MVRRAFGQSFVQGRMGILRGANGKYTAPEIVDVLPNLIGDFGDRTRRIGKYPIVVLFDEYGQAGVTEGILGPTLRNKGIEYISSGAVAEASDFRNFEPDGHLTPEVNTRLARALLGMIAGSMRKPFN
jgi:hypothetical protein